MDTSDDFAKVDIDIVPNRDRRNKMTIRYEKKYKMVEMIRGLDYEELTILFNALKEKIGGGVFSIQNSV